MATGSVVPARLGVRLAALRSVAAAAASYSDPASIARVSLDVLADRLGVAFGVVWLSDEAHNCLLPHAWVGSSAPEGSASEGLSFDSSFDVVEDFHTGESRFVTVSGIDREYEGELQRYVEEIDPSIHSYVNIPLLSKTSRGVLVLGWREPYVFDHETELYLRAIADVIGAAIDHTSTVTSLQYAKDALCAALDTVRLRTNEVETFLEHLPVGAILAEAPSGRVLLGNRMMSEIWQRPVQATEHVVEFFAGRGFHRDGRPYERDEWPIQRAMSLGESILGEELEFERGDGTRGFVSISAAPVRDTCENIVAGVVVCEDVSARKNAERERAELVGRLDAELVRRQLLLDTAAVFAESLEFDEVLETIVAATVEAVGRERVVVYLFDQSSTVLNVAATSDDFVPESAVLLRVASLMPIVSRMLEIPSQWVVRSSELTEGDSAGGEEEHEHALLTPLAFGDRLLGWLRVDRDAANGFSEQERALAAGIASQGALALETSLLFSAQSESLRLNQVLTEIDHEMHSRLEIDSILDTAIQQAADALDATAAGTLILEGDRLVARHATGEAVNDLGRSYSRSDAPNAFHLLEQRIVAVVDDGPEGEEALVPGSCGTTAMLAAPIFTHDRLYGLLFFSFCGPPRSFLDAEREFCRRLGVSVSLALDNARAFSAEHRIAETLQSALLSVPDRLDGVTFHQVYRSASEIARVGGDFYDLIELGPGRVGVLIGDVSGKGIEASVMTSLVRNTVRAYALDQLPAGEVTCRVNRAVFSASARDVFVTLFFGIVDVSHSTLEYCNAGHPAPILLPPSAPPVKLEPTAPIVGAYEEASYSCGSCPIETGSTLLLFTDGLTEARRDGELFGDDRVFSVARGKRWDSPRKLVDAVVREAISFSRGDLIDDVAVVALRLEPDAYQSIPRQSHLSL